FNFDSSMGRSENRPGHRLATRPDHASARSGNLACRALVESDDQPVDALLEFRSAGTRVIELLVPQANLAVRAILRNGQRVEAGALVVPDFHVLREGKTAGLLILKGGLT